MTAPKWIPVAQAADIEGGTLKSFQEWMRSWNLNTATANKVKRRHGKVELNSLIAALDEDAQRFDQGERVQAAYRALSSNSNLGAGRRRKTSALNQKGEHA